MHILHQPEQLSYDRLTFSCCGATSAAISAMAHAHIWRAAAKPAGPAHAGCSALLQRASAHSSAAMRMPPCPQTTSDRFGQAEAAARQRGEAGGAPPETPHGREPAAALHVRSAREVLAPCVEAARRLVADADLEEVAHALAQRPQPRIVRRAVAVSKHHLLKRLLSSEPCVSARRFG